jgi:hypothetical protein
MVNHATARDYLGYLDIVYLTATLPPWSTNLTSILVMTPKAYLTDSGLAAALLGAEPTALAAPGHPLAGPLVEPFAFTDSPANSPPAASAPNCRSSETATAVKSTSSSNDMTAAPSALKSRPPAYTNAFKHLRWMKERIGDRFKTGYVPYLGD